MVSKQELERLENIRMSFSSLFQDMQRDKIKITNQKRGKNLPLKEKIYLLCKDWKTPMDIINDLGMNKSQLHHVKAVMRGMEKSKTNKLISKLVDGRKSYAMDMELIRTNTNLLGNTLNLSNFLKIFDDETLRELTFQAITSTIKQSNKPEMVNFLEVGQNNATKNCRRAK